MLSPRATGAKRERWSDRGAKGGLKGRGEEGRREGGGSLPRTPPPLERGPEEAGAREVSAVRSDPVIPLTATRARGAPGVGGGWGLSSGDSRRQAGPQRWRGSARRGSRAAGWGSRVAPQAGASLGEGVSGAGSKRRRLDLNGDVHPCQASPGPESRQNKPVSFPRTPGRGALPGQASGCPEGASTPEPGAQRGPHGGRWPRLGDPEVRAWEPQGLLAGLEGAAGLQAEDVCTVSQSSCGLSLHPGPRRPEPGSLRPKPQLLPPKGPRLGTGRWPQTKAGCVAHGRGPA